MWWWLEGLVGADWLHMEPTSTPPPVRMNHGFSVKYLECLEKCNINPIHYDLDYPKSVHSVLHLYQHVGLYYHRISM